MEERKELKKTTPQECIEGLGWHFEDGLAGADYNVRQMLDTLTSKGEELFGEESLALNDLEKRKLWKETVFICHEINGMIGTTLDGIAGMEHFLNELEDMAPKDVVKELESA